MLNCQFGITVKSMQIPNRISGQALHVHLDRLDQLCLCAFECELVLALGLNRE